MTVGANERLRDILEAGQRAQALAAARPPTEPIVRLPALDKPRAALIVLHGRGQRAEDVVEQWAAAADLLLVAPHSTQPFDSHSGCWDDPLRAEADVRRATASALGGADTGDLPMLIAGFSQGAGLAMFLAAHGRLDGLAGCIAMAPTAGWTLELIGSDGPSVASGLRCALLVGTLDPRLEDCRRLTKQLRVRGAEVRLDLIDDLGHDYPADFGQRLPAAVDWLLD